MDRRVISQNVLLAKPIKVSHFPVWRFMAVITIYMRHEQDQMADTTHRHPSAITGFDNVAMTWLDFPSFLLKSVSLPSWVTTTTPPHCVAIRILLIAIQSGNNITSSSLPPLSTAGFFMGENREVEKTAAGGSIKNGSQ